MAKKHIQGFPSSREQRPQIKSLLDKMEDGCEFESLLKYQVVSLDFVAEIRKSLAEIKAVRNRPAICYLSNFVNQNIKTSISIDYTDDLPFSEMISSIEGTVKEIDIIIATPGGSAEQVAKFVDKLRPRFTNVAFIIPSIAMSAGTIFALSGDEIIMDSRAYIGPIDPQVPNKDGHYVPAQAILALIDDIQKRGENLLAKGQKPPWTDLQILRQLDGKEIGNALNVSRYSIELAENYLRNYKFKTWDKHSDGRKVEDTEKEKRASEIAKTLCSNEQWKTHSRGITREAAWSECKIKITHLENIAGLNKAIRRFWALIYWVFENTSAAKVFLSDGYCIIRNDPSLKK
jgi:hypothetical protein